VLGELEAKEKWDGALILDAGDLFFDKFTVTPSKAAETSATAMFLVEQYNKIGCHGFTPGDRDLVLGLDALRDLEKKADFPFILSNLVDAKTEVPLFKSHVITEVGGVKVGIFGLVMTQAVKAPADGEALEMKVLDPVATAKRMVATLKDKGAELIIVMAHLKDAELKALAQSVPGLPVILGGDGTRMVKHPEQFGGSFVASAFSKGKYVGMMNLHFHDGKARTGPIVDRFAKSGIEAKIASIEGRIKSYESIVARKEKDEKFAADKAERTRKAEKPAVAPPRPSRAGAEFYTKQLDKFRAELSELRAQAAEVVEVDQSANFMGYELVALSRKVIDDPTIESQVTAFRVKFPKPRGK